ncbi:hypothetical protein HOP50_15g74270 [Chloropicon primus]|uniref:Uncharacterized protein n=1 Tax=Chloropicon primus TaxID=1764295 RepID=A0A5B8MZM6_9CHLO|nr:hypothetical protein A3770_15p74020 [Chloropicon primus]UPR04094.1 hypothetical protein HOP50_15g74270 [Chloropicon primus]|eukprot:QDZ24884.1 hypothetical protein A3770_15p74020 [Chloropicon primus]
MTHCVAQLRTFSNKTLQDNWFEDRVQEGLDVNQSKPVSKNELSLMFASGEGQSERLEHLTRHARPDSRRTLPILSDDDESRFTSTYKANSMETIQQKKFHGKDSGRKLLVNRLNLGKTIRTQRVLQNGDDLLPKHPPSKDAKYFETSNSIMYGKDPDSVRDKWDFKPLPEKGNDNRFIGGYAAKCNPNDEYHRAFYGDSRYFFKTGSIEKDSYAKSMFAAQPRGKCGARGELVRAPDESGAILGTSVWADEYGSGRLS